MFQSWCCPQMFPFLFSLHFYYSKNPQHTDQLFWFFSLVSTELIEITVFRNCALSLYDALFVPDNSTASLNILVEISWKHCCQQLILFYLLYLQLGIETIAFSMRNTFRTVDISRLINFYIEITFGLGILKIYITMH